jgi:hypothetical protein
MEVGGPYFVLHIGQAKSLTKAVKAARFDLKAEMGHGPSAAISPISADRRLDRRGDGEI